MGKEQKNAQDLRTWRDPEGQDFDLRKGRSARSVPESTLPALSLMLGDQQPPLRHALQC